MPGKRIGMHVFTTVARNDAGPPATAHSYADRGGILILIGALHLGRLHDDDTTFLDDPVREATATARTVDADHGRIETRAATVSTATAWPQADYKWPGPPLMSRVLHRTLFADPMLATPGQRGAWLRA